MSSLLKARADYEAALRTIGKPVQVSVHGGTFTQRELERYSKQAPHVVLTLLGFDPTFEGGYLHAEAHWGLMCFTKQETGNPRVNSCVSLTEAVCQCLTPLFAGEEAVSRPFDMRARNVYSTPLDALGIAMWSIEWRQTLDLVEPIDTADWKTLDVVYDLQPRQDGAALFEVPEAEDRLSLPTE